MFVVYWTCISVICEIVDSHGVLFGRKIISRKLFWDPISTLKINFVRRWEDIGEWRYQMSQIKATESDIGEYCLSLCPVGLGGKFGWICATGKSVEGQLGTFAILKTNFTVVTLAMNLSGFNLIFIA